MNMQHPSMQQHIRNKMLSTTISKIKINIPLDFNAPGKSSKLTGVSHPASKHAAAGTTPFPIHICPYYLQ